MNPVLTIATRKLLLEFQDSIFKISSDNLTENSYPVPENMNA